MLPEVAGALGGRQCSQSAHAIALVQSPDGCIAGVPGGIADPWNHVESAMGLDVGGCHDEAAAAYRWLAEAQRPDGSWAAGYRGGEVVDATADANFCAYLATGLWHHHLKTGELAFLAEMWPVLERAMGFTLGLQARGGEIYWARDEEGRPWPRGLLTSSSCIHLSLACAVAVAERLGQPRPAWEEAWRRLGEAIRCRPEAFEPKHRFAMDWYYPILGGAVTGAAAVERLAGGWERFVVPGRGVRCVADRAWVTAAETCELVLALVVLGRRQEARDLFGWVQSMRAGDGSYWTGATFPEGQLWPDERPTWTTAAVLLAADALGGCGPASALYRDAAARSLRSSLRLPTRATSSKDPDSRARR